VGYARPHEAAAARSARGRAASLAASRLLNNRARGAIVKAAGARRMRRQARSGLISDISSATG